MRLSIVATLYRSAEYIGEFHRRATQAAHVFAGDDYEIVLVNDGSPDHSLRIALELADEDPRVCVVDLSRNFGHHKAMMTGLAHARGDLVFLIDSDLEEQPEWLESFARKLCDDGCDVVFGVQKKRKGNIFERWSGDWFYRIFRTATGVDLPHNIVTARLMRRSYVDALLQYDERELFLAGIWHIVGFDQRSIRIDKLSLSPTTYSVTRKFHILIDSITSFSNAPLIGIFYFGFGIFMLASAYIAYLVVIWAVIGTVADGWTSVMASIWLIGGLIISFMGVIGIYLSKIYTEAKRRPYTLVRSVHRGGLAAPSNSREGLAPDSSPKVDMCESRAAE
ncbi:glycosyltransferase family 2 protein [Aurantimonas marina]|uniref:glycosyltransferase family 2 protein n=1 Tax=Aurantimonas marina TaxID=2780508 RepID=UPI0019D262FF|nr:glycosyltransferase family 2 protein [Aurantimonas marina]